MKPARSVIIMWTVAGATLPALAASGYLYGSAVWQQLFIGMAAALATEAACLYWRRQSLAAVLDGSAVVAACVLAVALPPQAPWFVAAAAAFAAMALAKHCYGGLGNNPFNPAMAGYALVFLSFPQYFDMWLPAADAVTGPTPLATARLSAEWGTGEDGLIAAAAAAGGLVLLLLRFADWRLPLAFILAAAAMNAAAGGSWQLLTAGGLVFAAFFVITDPVTAAVSRRGRWLYAGLAGALAIGLRHYGAHTDGIAFAVLIGNMLAPLCDRVAGKWRI